MEYEFNQPKNNENHREVKKYIYIISSLEIPVTTQKILGYLEVRSDQFLRTEKKWNECSFHAMLRPHLEKFNKILRSFHEKNF